MTPDQLREALAAHATVDMPALPGRRNHLWSGVLVPIVWNPDPVCIATVRTATLSKHAGEVCFPGGRPDPDDDDLRATALREAHEELGIADAEVLGGLSSIPLYTSDYRLSPYVARIEDTPLTPNPSEVDRVLRFPIEGLVMASHVDALAYLRDGVEGLSPIFESDGHIMFGATAHSFYELLMVVAPLFGTTVPPLKKSSRTWSDVLPASQAPASS